MSIQQKIQRQIQASGTITMELVAEVARDRWIAQDAISRLYQGTPIDRIENEPLSALYYWIGSELQDRGIR